MFTMAKSKNKERRHGISALGVLLIICMLLLAGITLGVNLLYRKDSAPKIGDKYFCYYTADDMTPTIPVGTMVIAREDSTVSDSALVLYRDTAGQSRIGRLALTAEDDVFKTTTYYLTVENSIDPEPRTVPQSSVLGVCTHKSAELGAAVGFLTGLIGIIICLIAPCIVLVLYLIAAAAAAKEHKRQAEEEDDDSDTDLAFVKSIQKKQQEIAERDAERMAKTGTDTDKPAPPKKQPRRYTDEELAQLEEQEAALRAQRIAAVRSHMEQRRQTETPDGVPLITTEVLTRTHPIPVPRTTGELTVTRQIPKAGTETTAVRPVVKAETPAAAEAPAPAEFAVTAAPETPAAPAEPAAPPATYEELMAMLDDQISKLQ